jgi:hypothetical protein
MASTKMFIQELPKTITNESTLSFQGGSSALYFTIKAFSFANSGFDAFHEHSIAVTNNIQKQNGWLHYAAF